MLFLVVVMVEVVVPDDEVFYPKQPSFLLFDKVSPFSLVLSCIQCCQATVTQFKKKKEEGEKKKKEKRFLRATAQA